MPSALGMHSLKQLGRASVSRVLAKMDVHAAPPNRKTFYKRVLPTPPAIAFSSPEGRAIFAEAQAAGTMNGFFKLIEQFSTQDEPAYCGLSSLAMTLNALSIDPKRPWKGVWRWFHEELLDCCKPLGEVQKDGVTLSQAACLARCNGARVELRRHGTFSLAEFRKHLLAACASGEHHVVVSYSRKVFLQSGDGHFSPVGGFHETRDLALILDVARFKYPPHWVPVSQLFDAMAALDPHTGHPRGFLCLSQRATVESVAFTLDISGESALWKPADDFVRLHAPALLQTLLAQASATLLGQDGSSGGNSSSSSRHDAVVSAVSHLVEHVPLDSANAFMLLRNQLQPTDHPAAVAQAMRKPQHSADGVSFLPSPTLSSSAQSASAPETHTKPALTSSTHSTPTAAAAAAPVQAAGVAAPYLSPQQKAVCYSSSPFPHVPDPATCYAPTLRVPASTSFQHLQASGAHHSASQIYGTSDSRTVVPCAVTTSTHSALTTSINSPSMVTGIGRSTAHEQSPQGAALSSGSSAAALKSSSSDIVSIPAATCCSGPSCSSPSCDIIAPSVVPLTVSSATPSNTSPPTEAHLITIITSSTGASNASLIASSVCCSAVEDAHFGGAKAAAAANVPFAPPDVQQRILAELYSLPLYKLVLRQLRRQQAAEAVDLALDPETGPEAAEQAAQSSSDQPTARLQSHATFSTDSAHSCQQTTSSAASASNADKNTLSPPTTSPTAAVHDQSCADGADTTTRPLDRAGSEDDATSFANTAVAVSHDPPATPTPLDMLPVLAAKVTLLLLLRPGDAWHVPQKVQAVAGGSDPAPDPNLVPDQAGVQRAAALQHELRLLWDVSSSSILAAEIHYLREQLQHLSELQHPPKPSVILPAGLLEAAEHVDVAGAQAVAAGRRGIVWD